MPLTKLFNLFMLFSYVFLASRYLDARHLLWAMVGLLAFQLAKFMYCVWLLLHHQFFRVYWLPTGIPRFTLVMGGMTANQMGAMWLVPVMVIVALRMFNVWRSNWYWLAIAIGSLGAVSTGSRSMLIGLFILFFICVYLRGQRRDVVLITCAIVAAVLVYVIIEPSRLADASALKRLDFWSNSLSSIEQNPLFGAAFGTNLAPHSVWVQLLSDTGLVGFSLAMLSLLRLFVGNTRDLRLSRDLFGFLFLPYCFFLSVDIPLLQWQTWILPVSVCVIQKYRAGIIETYARVGVEC